MSHSTQVPNQRLNQARVNLVFGNHGELPTHLEDNFKLLERVIEYTGGTYRYRTSPEAEETNVLIEHFDRKWTQEILQIKAESPQTRFLILATEFLTGSSFNDFTGSDSAALETLIPVAVSNPVGHIFQRVRIDRFAHHILRQSPIYETVRRAYRRTIKPVEAGSHYDDRAYWKDRYRNFERLIESTDSTILTIAPFQSEAYRRRFGAERVVELPLFTNLKSPRINFHNQESDIDVLFSGTLTRYREKFLNRLRTSGLRVEALSVKSPQYIREDFVKRAKINLHLRQDENWQYPSPMRIHSLLEMGAYVLAEKSGVTCEFESLVPHLKQEDLFEKILMDLRSPINFFDAHQFYAYQRRSGQMNTGVLRNTFAPTQLKELNG